MAVSNEDNLKRVHGDGSTPTISFLFRVLQTSDLRVYKILLSTGVAVLLTEGVDYSVTVEADGQGGNVIFTGAVSALYDILILNQLELTQTAELPTEGNFNETSVETALDRCILIDIQQQEQINRCLKLNSEDELNDGSFDGFFLAIDTAANRANKLVIFNSSGDGLETGPDSTDVSIVAANIASVNTVSANIASVNTCAANIASINTVAANIAGLNNLAAIAAIGTTGIYTRTGAGTAAARTITGTTDQITLTNGNGVAGNPTISLPTGIQFGTVHTFAASNNCILGGVSNTISTGVQNAIIGGFGNIDNSARGAIIGGLSNENTGSQGVILGGTGNINSGTYSVISGSSNTSSATYGFIGGGAGHTISDQYTGIVGGEDNTCGARYGFIGGGQGNVCNYWDSTIIGGQSNQITGGNQSASSCNAILNGAANTISVTAGQFNAIIGGTNNTIDGVAAQYNTILSGLGCKASYPAFACLVMGYQAKGTMNCSQTIGAGNFSAVGDAQTSVLPLSASTTNNTVTELTNVGSHVVIPTDTTWAFSCLVVARRSDADNESAAYRVEGCIDNNAGTVALVGAVTVTVIAEDTAAWDCTAVADNVNKSLNIKGTGENAKTIKWVGRLTLVEVTA